MSLSTYAGYATEIFLPAGIALAVLLNRGTALWPGVLLGSILLHIAIAVASPEGLTPWRAAIAAPMILAATIEVLLGVVLLRRFVPNHAQLDDGASIVRFLVLGGPIAGLLTPAVGCLTLWVSATASAEALPFTFWTWWIGNSVGVAIAAPVTLTFLNRRAPLWRQRSTALTIPSVIALCAIIAIFVLTDRLENEHAISEFQDRTSDVHDEIRENAQNYIRVVSSVHRFVDAASNMDEETFARFVDNLVVSFPEILAFEWVPRVPFAERQELEARARKGSWKNFQIWEPGKNGSPITATDRKEYFPILFAAPLVGNRQVLGFDVRFDPDGRRALEAARDSGQPTTTGLVPRGSFPNREKGLVIFAPLYGQIQEAGSIDARRTALRGFVLGKFKFFPLVKTMLPALESAGVALEIRDITPDEPEQLLFNSSPDTASSDHPLATVYQARIAERMWQLKFRALASYGVHGGSLQSWLAHAAGILFAGLLQAFLLNTTGQTSNTRRQIAERTEELVKEVEDRRRVEEDLRSSEARVTGIVNTVTDGIITINRAGIVETANPAAEYIFGWQTNEMIGQNVKMLVAEPDQSAHDSYLSNYLETGEKTIIGQGREVMGRRKSGAHFPVELAVSELKSSDRHIFVGVLRDISTRKLAEENLRNANDIATATVATLQQRDHELSLLSKMNDLLMACKTHDEAYRVIQISTQEIFAGLSGSLAITSKDGYDLQKVVQWGKTKLMAGSFSVDDCWGLRKGTLHEITDPVNDLTCGHTRERSDFGQICLPLMVGGLLFGLMVFEIPVSATKKESFRELIVAVGETVKLALSNLDLREALREQAIRDPLTRLLNRRAMEEELEREIARSNRNGSPLIVCMIDADKFKRVNDVFGHDAGDHVLRELGALLSEHCRSSDIVCRYGGEEFVIIMPDAKIDGATRRVEEIRQRFKGLNIKHGGKQIEALTLSAGLAFKQDTTRSADSLLKAADEALYAAKEGGRDRLVVAEGSEIAAMQPEVNLA